MKKDAALSPFNLDDTFYVKKLQENGLIIKSCEHVSNKNSCYLFPKEPILTAYKPEKGEVLSLCAKATPTYIYMYNWLKMLCTHIVLKQFIANSQFFPRIKNIKK